jgi:hypothetical protein
MCIPVLLEAHSDRPQSFFLRRLGLGQFFCGVWASTQFLSVGAGAVFITSMVGRRYVACLDCSTGIQKD